MSRYYKAEVEVSAYNPAREEHIKKALRQMFYEISFQKKPKWPHDPTLVSPIREEFNLISSTARSGRVFLTGGEAEDEFAKRVADAAVTANKGPCRVCVALLYAESDALTDDDWQEFYPTGENMSTTDVTMSGPIVSNMAQEAVNMFGITYDINEAGFILPDGSMLDFSGRHWDSHYKMRPFDKVWETRGDDYFKGSRSVDHGDVGALPSLGSVEPGGHWHRIYKFMKATGAVRVSMPVGFDVIAVPTDEQVDRMSKAPRSWASIQEPYISVDFSDKNGDSESMKVYFPLTRKKIMNAIAKASKVKMLRCETPRVRFASMAYDFDVRVTKFNPNRKDDIVAALKEHYNEDDNWEITDEEIYVQGEGTLGGIFTPEESGREDAELVMKANRGPCQVETGTACLEYLEEGEDPEWEVSVFDGSTFTFLQEDVTMQAPDVVWERATSIADNYNDKHAKTGDPDDATIFNSLMNACDDLGLDSDAMDTRWDEHEPYGPFEEADPSDIYYLLTGRKPVSDADITMQTDKKVVKTSTSPALLITGIVIGAFIGYLLFWRH